MNINDGGRVIASTFQTLGGPEAYVEPRIQKDLKSIRMVMV
jgi:hypothetical protein